MKRITLFAFALVALASCGLKEEFQPVFTGKYENPQNYEYYSDSDFGENSPFGKLIPIGELAQTYTPGHPYQVKDDITIKGWVSTTDKPGNFYKSFYIEDGSAGIEIKVGKNGLYNDYLPGQTVYVYLKGLTVGMYGFKSGSYGGMGMVQVGFADPSGEYETSYMELPNIINEHILRGDPDYATPVNPQLITESDLPDPLSDTQATNPYVGALVTLKGLKYDNETFVLLYLDSNKDKKSGTNRIFLSDDNGIGACGKTHGITTWAMSKIKMKELLLSGIWDDAEVASGSVYLLDDNGNHVKAGDLKGDGTYPGIEKAAYSVSQYFKMGSTSIQIRTSGYSKFSDREIPEEVLDGSATLDVTGVISLYEGSIQLTVNNISDFVVNGKPLE